MRLIDADVLIAELQKDEERFDKEAEDAKDDPSYIKGYSNAMWSRANGIRDAIIEVYDAPTIEPKQGEWLFKKITDDYHVTGQCSICKERRRIDNFCPNCGAKMKE